MKNKINEGMILEGQISFLSNGNAKVNDIFIYKKNTHNALHLDNVKIETFRKGNKLEAKVIEVTNRFKNKFVGRAQVTDKNIFVIPDNNKIPVDFYIKGGLIPENNQKVVVEFTKWKDKSPQGKIVEILGDPGDNDTEINSIMIEFGLPKNFPQEVINESELLSDVFNKKDLEGREDLRTIPTFTIDPETARDFDDALSVNFIDGNAVIGIHIADVSHYVKEGSEIDKEAYKRATSVYLVDRVVPMLPEKLSNDLCSLKPNVDRLAFSVIFTFDKDHKIINTWMGKSIIQSDKRMSYEEAQSIIENKDGEYKNEVLTLNRIAKKLRKQRIKKGSIEMSSIEVKFDLDEDTKKPIGVSFKEQKDSNRLIEEFMLLANRTVAKKLSDAEWFNIYRTHNTPNMDKLIELQNICKTFNHELIVSEDPKLLKSSINELIKSVNGTPEQNMIETLITRSMSKAKYEVQNIGHYGLGFDYYSHFTSPIRRYPDLLLHRILFKYLNKSSQGNPNKLEEQSKWCSERELTASKAQRDSIKYKQVEFLSDKVGHVFDGMVSGVTDWGIYVELIDNKCEGMIRYNTLEDKWFVDTYNHLVSNTYGDVIRLGDPIKVAVSSVDLERKQIDFIKL